MEDQRILLGVRGYRFRITSYNVCYTKLLRLILRYNSLYLEELDRLITRVRIFRTHFAALDIRQDPSVHSQSIEAILKYSGKIHESLDEIGEDDSYNFV